MVGAPSDKHALSFGTRAALARTDLKRPDLWAVHLSGPKWTEEAHRATALLPLEDWKLARTSWRWLGQIFRAVCQPL